MKILVVDDDQLVSEILLQALSPYYRVELASNGQCGLEMALQFDFDLIVLDVMMPEMNGIDLCRTLRIEKQTPILLLTAKNSHQDRLIGFEAGADDYVCKPFDLRELLARVHALMRRESGAVKMPILTWGIITVTVRRKQVLCGRNLVELTVKEYDILELLLRNPGQVFSRTAILNRLWTSSETPGEETISTHIKCIRKKLRDQGSADPIETIYGRGYCLRSLPQSESIMIGSDQPTPDFTIAPRSAAPLGFPTHSPSLHPTPALVPAQISAPPVTIWDNPQDHFWAQVAVLEQAVAAIASHRLEPWLKDHAQQQADRLASALDRSGLIEEAHLAHQIDRLLQGEIIGDDLQIHQITDWVQQLKSRLHRQNSGLSRTESWPIAEPPEGDTFERTPFEGDRNPSFSDPHRPRLLIIDRQWHAEILQQQARCWGLVADIATHNSIAHPVTHPNNPAAILFNLSSYEAIDDSPEPLSLIQDLHHQSPHSPIFVITHGQGRVSDRLFFARLGGCSSLDVAGLELWPIDREHPSATLFKEILISIDQSAPQLVDPFTHFSLQDRNTAV